MKIILLIASFLAIFQIGKAQNAADYFLLHDIQKQLIPSDYPYYLLTEKYSGHSYWCTHIKSLPLLSKLQKKIDNTLLVLSPLERSDISNNGKWDCEIIDNPKCITDSARKEILFDKIATNYKWWWSKKKKTKEYEALAKILKANKMTKPIYDRTVYTIHEPWILKKGLICLIYLTIETYDKNKEEKIYVFDRVDENWVLQTIL